MNKTSKLECKEISLRKFVRYINSHGFQFVRSSSGHMIFKKGDITFAVPSHKTIKTGIIWQFNSVIRNNGYNNYQ